MSQSDLALGETETIVSRWLSGTHNLTIATIAKMATVLVDDIITATSTGNRRHIISPMLLLKQLW